MLIDHCQDMILTTPARAAELLFLLVGPADGALADRWAGGRERLGSIFSVFQLWPVNEQHISDYPSSSQTYRFTWSMQPVLHSWNHKVTSTKRSIRAPTMAMQVVLRAVVYMYTTGRMGIQVRALRPMAVETVLPLPTEKTLRFCYFDVSAYQCKPLMRCVGILLPSVLMVPHEASRGFQTLSKYSCGFWVDEVENISIAAAQD